MTVFELVGKTASIDWASRGETVGLGLFTSREKAIARIAEIKTDQEWYMEWEDCFEVVGVEVE